MASPAVPDRDPPPPLTPREAADLAQQMRSLRRLALAVARPGGSALHEELVAELAQALDVAVVFVGVFTDASRQSLRTLAARLDGRVLRNFEYALEGSPCAQVVDRFRYVAQGVGAEFRPDTLFAAKGMDAYAAYPLVDSDGVPLGLLVAMDRRPIAGGDAEHAEAMLKIVAGRLAGEIERSRTDAVLRDAALAVSGAPGDTVFDELVRMLAAILGVEIAFIARHDPAEPGRLRMLAMHYDGQMLRDIPYAVAGTPCETVLGQRFRAYPRDLQRLFPDDHDARAQGTESYAGYPLAALDGRPLGIVSVASRQPLLQIERVEAMLKIFAVRAAAELERLAASEALARSEASCRAIFEAAEDAIFIHDWDSGRILDVNAKAVETYGWSREEFVRLGVDDISAGTPPYTAADAMQWLALAKLGRCPPVEWRSRNKDGSLHWDEVRLKPAMIEGRPHVLAFTRDITERKDALAALQAREAQYRAIFETASDAFILWDEQLAVVDANPAALRMYGYTREQSIGKPAPRHLPPAYLEERRALVRRALAGETVQVETRALRADGSGFDVDLRVMPFHHQGRELALAVARDISEQRERERALQRSEARLRATVEASFDAVVGMDDEGRIVEFNAAAERVFGHRRDAVMGRLLADTLLPQRHRDAHTRGLKHFHTSGRGPMVGRLVETTALRADGSEFPVELAISVAQVPEGSIFVGHLRDITERRAADQALRDSEAQYRAIFNASADALVLRDADFRIVDVNATYERMSGFTRDEVIGVDRVLANPPQMHAEIRALHERALAGEAVAIETRLMRRDGIGYELELRGVPTPHRGRPHVLYIGRDITERKRVEQALRDSEAQYRAIFNASTDALILWNSRYERVDVNDAYERLYGWPREKVLGRGFDAQRYTPEQAHPRRELVRRALAGERCSAELEAVCHDGRRILTEVQAIPFRHRGEPHVLAIARDITERRHAEQALRASEEQYRAIFNASADALVLRDADYHAVDVNPAYLAMTGYTRDEVLGAPRVLTQHDPARRALHRRQHDEVLRGQALRFEAGGRRKDGAELTLEVHAMPVTHRGLPHVLYAARDITERRAAEAQRSELERQLRQAQKMEAIGQLTGGIAHDFNNILTSVIGWQAMAQERAEAIGDAALQRQLAQGRLAAERARDLVAQMLAFARRQRGERRPVALAPLVRRTLGLLRATLPATLTLHTEGLDAPAADDGPHVLADPVQLEQVLFNLCINARDAMPGGGRLEVRLAAPAEAPRWHCASCRARPAGGAWVRMAVQDDGEGIAPALVERIFDPFFSTKAPGSGSGMGLAMVHGIVHDHGGHLVLHTAPGAGACFEVWLPRAGADAADAAPAGRATPAAAPPLQGRVLLVEDDAMVGEYLTERLRGWGLAPTWIRDPLAALALLQDAAQRFALLITDQTMPGLTGLQLAERVGALRPALPRLLISGNAEAFEPAALQRAGIVAALPKPLDETRLRSHLQHWLALDTDTLHAGG
jgi:PAS domain S-box-containing protein